MLNIIFIILKHQADKSYAEDDDSDDNNKNTDTIIELFPTQLNNIIAELIYFFLARCEWIRSERFAKKLREEAQKREKNNPMKAGRQLRNQDCHAIVKYRKYWTLYWKYFPFEKKNNLI
jgi:hypothetical protein